MITLFRSLFAPPRHLILLLVALWIGLALSEKRAERHQLSKDSLNNIVFYSILAYVVGGRLLFALANLSAFTQSPLSIASINIDLFDPVGALVSALVIGFVYGQRQKLAWGSTLDALTPLFATMMIGLSLSHLAAGTAFGKPTDLPWGIQMWNANRHLTQIYELVASLLVFSLIWFRKTDPQSGILFLTFTALTAGARLFLEAFRGDSTLVAGGLRVAQILSWIVLAVALIIDEWFREKRKTEQSARSGS